MNRNSTFLRSLINFACESDEKLLAFFFIFASNCSCELLFEGSNFAHGLTVDLASTHGLASSLLCGLMVCQGLTSGDLLKYLKTFGVNTVWLKAQASKAKPV